MTLTGKRAIITGASRGIGRAIALAFAQEGADIAFCHLHDAEGAAEVTTAVSALGRRAFAHDVDVADTGALKAFIATAQSELGGCDILLNNAGFNIRGPIAGISEEDFDRMIAVHMKAMYFAAQAVLPGMVAQGSGRIINIASQLAFKGVENAVLYCAAKAGVVGFTRALAREVAPKGVRVNAIGPGPVMTDLTAQNGPDWAANFAARLPIGRVGVVDDISPTAVLLAGPGGDFYVGACLSPNGGDQMH